MQKNVMKSLITLENKMAKLRQKTLKLSREEYLKNQSEEETNHRSNHSKNVTESVHNHCSASVDESLEIILEKVTCPKCRGDGNESNTTHIQDLCPADRKKITKLISELARCTQEKHKVTADLAVSKAEIEALKNQLQLFNSQQEDDKNKLRLQLSHTTAEMNKLRLQTSHSLKLLTEQIMALENQSSRLIEAVKDLFNDKVSLQDALITQKLKVRFLEAKIGELKDSKDMEKLSFVDQKIKNQALQKSDKDCQTEDERNLQKIYSCSRLKIFETTQETHRFSKVTQVKSKHDLDESSSEAILLRELFFKRPSIDENEGLDLLPKLLKS